jgi:hypothetical protein
MIKIINEFADSKFKLVPRIDVGRCSCCGCDFYNEGKKQCHFAPYWMEFNHQMVCKKLHGIWKEVKNEETAL